MSGWIEYDGKGCPAGIPEEIDVKFRDGHTHNNSQHWFWSWVHTGYGSDIISYRVSCGHPHIVGICGKAGSGKDTVAQFLVKYYGYKQVSFASTLKEMLKVMGYPEPVNRDDKEKIIEDVGVSWRHMAQTLGSDWGRDLIHKDIWIKSVLNKLESGERYVISDVRFDGESVMVRQHGFMIHLRGREVDLGNLGSHASEAGVIVYPQDHQITNSGSLDYLYSKIGVIMGAANDSYKS